MEGMPKTRPESPHSPAWTRIYWQPCMPITLLSCKSCSGTLPLVCALPGSHKHSNPAFENCYRNDELVNDTYFQVTACFPSCSQAGYRSSFTGLRSITMQTCREGNFRLLTLMPSAPHVELSCDTWAHHSSDWHSLPECLLGGTEFRLRCMLRHLHVQDYVGRSMGMHTRYPGHDGHRPQPGSPLGRVIGIINEVRDIGLLLSEPSLRVPFSIYAVHDMLHVRQCTHSDCTMRATWKPLQRPACLHV